MPRDPERFDGASRRSPDRRRAARSLRPREHHDRLPPTDSATRG